MIYVIITDNYTVKTTFALTGVAIMDRGTSDKVEVRLRIPPADRQKQRLDVRVNGQAMMFDDGPMAWQDFKGITMYYIYPKYSDTLIHLCGVDSSTLTLWTVHFQ